MKIHVKINTLFELYTDALTEFNLEIKEIIQEEISGFKYKKSLKNVDIYTHPDYLEIQIESNKTPDWFKLFCKYKISNKNTLNFTVGSLHNASTVKLKLIEALLLDRLSEEFKLFEHEI